MSDHQSRIQELEQKLRPELERLAEESLKCMKCGLCQAVCPVYRQERGESFVARGRISLVEAALAGRIRWSPLMEERLSTCLICQACLAGCPSGVRIDRVMVDARTVLAQRVGFSLPKRLALRKLLRDGRLDSYVKFGRRFQRMALRPSGRGLFSPVAGLDRARRLPALARQTLYEYPQISRREDGTVVLAEPAGGLGHRGRITYFPGCLTTYIYPEIGLAVGRVLGALGYEVVLPREPVCCGEPALLNGDKETAEVLVERVGESLRRGSEVIVTACASCGTMLKKEYPELGVDLDAPVLDVTELLVADGNIDRLAALGAFGSASRPTRSTKVTYHDPCHLKHARGVTAPPRELLRRMAGDSFVEMKESACCGAGGSFSLRHYALTSRIGKRQAQLIGDTGAEIVATACPGCIMQTNENLARAGKDTRAKHVAELLAEALNASNR